MTRATTGGTTPKAAELDERTAYIALALTPRITPRRLARLLSDHGSACAAIQRAPRHTVREAIDAMRTATTREHTILVPRDAGFPAALRSIPDPPPILFARGNLSLLNRRSVAIVGSRDHTGYGETVAGALATAASRAGIVVISGMARGLDAVAHAAALDAGGGTIGVLGNGLGVIYPAANRALYQRVEVDGLLVTEFPPGERPTQYTFPRRNRLISGLADVVVVVEAAAGSGTLVTVSAALQQGRDVMAVPGPITSVTSAGTNRLIADGAEPILSVDDLLAKFGEAPSAAATVVEVSSPPCSLSPDEARAYDALSAEPRLLDDVAITAGLPVGTLLGVLCGLELGGLVEQLPGALFRRRASAR